MTNIDAGIIKYVTPANADTLAVYSIAGNKFSLLKTLDQNPPASEYINFASTAPFTGKFTMGDWDNDNLETPGIYYNGVFRYATGIGTGVSWKKVKLPSRKKVVPVAG